MGSIYGDPLEFFRMTSRAIPRSKCLMGKERLLQGRMAWDKQPWNALSIHTHPSATPTKNYSRLWTPEGSNFTFRRQLNVGEIQRVAEFFTFLKFNGLQEGDDELGWQGSDNGSFKANNANKRTNHFGFCLRKQFLHMTIWWGKGYHYVSNVSSVVKNRDDKPSILHCMEIIFNQSYFMLEAWKDLQRHSRFGRSRTAG